MTPTGGQDVRNIAVVCAPFLYHRRDTAVPQVRLLLYCGHYCSKGDASPLPCRTTSGSSPAANQPTNQTNQTISVCQSFPTPAEVLQRKHDVAAAGGCITQACRLQVHDISIR